MGAIFSVNALPKVKITKIYSTIPCEQFIIVQGWTPSFSMPCSFTSSFSLHGSASLEHSLLKLENKNVLTKSSHGIMKPKQKGKQKGNPISTIMLTASSPVMLDHSAQRMHNRNCETL